jgi:hypothetical protein
LIAPFVHREVWVASGAPGADLGDWIAVLRWEGPGEFPSLPTGTDLDGEGAADYWFPGDPPPPPMFGPVSGVVELVGDRSGLASALGDVDGDGAADLVVEHIDVNAPVSARARQVLVYLGSPDW